MQDISANAYLSIIRPPATRPKDKAIVFIVGGFLFSSRKVFRVSSSAKELNFRNLAVEKNLCSKEFHFRDVEVYI